MIVVNELKKYYDLPSSIFTVNKPFVKAVDGVSFIIERGKTLGLVGESGSGKTTVGRVLLNLVSPTSGEVRIDGVDIYSLNRSELNSARKKLQIIFQDPYASLNPRMTVENIVSEGMVIHHMHRSSERREKAKELLRRVGLQESHIDRYPHEFSGGQRQRIGIARAISLNPEFIVCDEPVSALDVSIQAQIINLLMDLQETMKMAYLFISHDLAVVKQISHDVAVMYSGRIVEYAGKNDLFSAPLHPYTRGLLDAIPSIDLNKRHKPSIEKDSEQLETFNGCSFCGRCPKRMKVCFEQQPSETEPTKGHFVRCFLYGRHQAE